jgi:hypothetical protein
MSTINLSSNNINPEDCILEIPNVTYDKNELLKIYEQVKDYARVKYLPWNKTPTEFAKKDDVKAVTIQYNDHEIRNPADHGGGVNLLDFEYIRNLVGRFNLNIHPANVSMIIYKEGYVFKPHVDGWAASVLMFPIMSTSAIDFYHETGMQFESYKEYAMGYDKIIYSHYYSDTYPTFFNSHIIHGVKPTLGFQVKLKINLNDDFYSIRERYKSGILVK